MTYRALDADRILATLERLHLRISERFPDAGLARVCGELLDIASQTQHRAAQIAKPNLLVRGISMAMIASGIAALIYVASRIIDMKFGENNISGVMQGIEAGVSLLIVVGGGILFTSTLEARWKRGQALEDLYELRSIVHVIDMHQLTKDPSATVGAGTKTDHSPERTMTPFQLMRYLDYCSEMLAITAKLAALYAQSYRDPIVLETVSDLGQITTNMTNQIWQKINIIQATERSTDVTRILAERRLGQARAAKVEA
ncbi:MAG: hypothetical protein AAFR04_05890 [Pseudomonadota bacterium]